MRLAIGILAAGGETAAVVAIVTAGVAILIVLAWLPGYMARERGHANAAAIATCGWFSLVLPVLWIVAVIWAHTGPDNSDRVKWERTHGVNRRRGFEVRPKPPKGWVPAKSLNYDEAKL